MNPELFSPHFVRSLDRLSLLAKRLRRGNRPGRYRSFGRGRSLDFAGYRPYQPGDELRRLDFNILRRRERLYVREYEAEEELNLYLLLDVSASMGFGHPPKSELACRVAAALLYLGIKSGNSAGLALLRGETAEYLPPRRGDRALRRLFETLDKAEPSGTTHLNRALGVVNEAVRRPGLAVLISDFLDPRGFAAGLGRLAYAGNELVVIRLREEEQSRVDPVRPGEYRFRDSETGKDLRVLVSRSLLREYRREEEALEQEIRDFCYRRESHFLSFDSAAPFESIVLQYLRERGVIG